MCSTKTHETPHGLLQLERGRKAATPVIARSLLCQSRTGSTPRVGERRGKLAACNCREGEDAAMLLAPPLFRESARTQVASG